MARSRRGGTAAFEEPEAEEEEEEVCDGPFIAVNVTAPSPSSAGLFGRGDGVRAMARRWATVANGSASVARGLASAPLDRPTGWPALGHIEGSCDGARSPA